MDTYSGNTRVTLTTTGWLLMVEEALVGMNHTSNKKESAQLRCKAERSLRMALVSINEDHRSKDNLLTT
jgi:hypothetical protein